MPCAITSPILETDMDLDTKLTIPPQVMSRLVGDETVLLDLASGMYFGLDGVGKRIWESISEGKSLGETVAVIVAEYEVDEAQARQTLSRSSATRRTRPTGRVAPGTLRDRIAPALRPMPSNESAQSHPWRIVQEQRETEQAAAQCGCDVLSDRSFCSQRSSQARAQLPGRRSDSILPATAAHAVGAAVPPSASVAHAALRTPFCSQSVAAHIGQSNACVLQPADNIHHAMQAHLPAGQVLGERRMHEQHEQRVLRVKHPDIAIARRRRLSMSAAGSPQSTLAQQPPVQINIDAPRESTSSRLILCAVGLADETRPRPARLQPAPDLPAAPADRGQSRRESQDFRTAASRLAAPLISAYSIPAASSAASISFSALFLRQEQRFGRQAAFVKFVPTRALMPQRTQAMIDDERREIRTTPHPARRTSSASGNIRKSGKQGRSVIIEACHVVIVADS